jgi:Ras family protein T1
MEYLAYLGFPINNESDQRDGITVTREKRVDIATKASTRNVYRAHVIGAKNSGKSTLCAGLIGRESEVGLNRAYTLSSTHEPPLAISQCLFTHEPPPEKQISHYLPTHEPPPEELKKATLKFQCRRGESEFPRYVVNMVSVYGQEKYLVMQDIDLGRVLDILPTSEVLCDVAALVYDSSDPKSFEFVARTYLVRTLNF